MGLFKFYWTDASSDITGLIEDLRPGDYNTDPNSRYNGGEDLGTWNSLSDVDKFFNKYNHANGYKSTIGPLRLGDYVTINDGTYNAQWMIAGFDIEAGRAAADGTTYNSGYGIGFIPKIRVGDGGQWNTSNTTAGGYMSSYMHTTVLPGIVNKLKTVLGSHLVQRSVLLSSSISSNNSNVYSWTTAYATLMSIGQMNGTFAKNNTKYDDGEANYKLPVFNYMEFKTGFNFWSRGVRLSTNPWLVSGDGSLNYSGASNSYSVRPLIYLR